MTFAFEGEIACLTAAACWAVAVVWFRRPIGEVGARLVNLGKCAIATVLLTGTAAALGQFGALGSIGSRDLGLIALSGVVGMAIGDTALFAAVGRLGAHRTLLLQTLAPVFASVAAYLALGERLTAGQLTGGAVVLAAVALVVAGPRTAADPPDTRRIVAGGVGLAVLAALGQALGVVIAKPALPAMPVLLATWIRLSAASLGLGAILVVQGRGPDVLRIARSGSDLLRIGRPAVLGTYVAVLLMMFGISRAPASIAAVLLATSPIFSLFVEAGVDRRRIPVSGFVATFLAVVGVALLSIG